MIWFFMAWVLLITGWVLVINNGSLEIVSFVTLGSLSFLILSYLTDIQKDIENLKGGKKRR